MTDDTEPGESCPSYDTAVSAQRLALCCQCGAVRSTAIHDALTADFVVHPNDLPRERCTVLRKCNTCRDTTVHAYLRTDDDRDFAERSDRKRVDGHWRTRTEQLEELVRSLSRLLEMGHRRSTAECADCGSGVGLSDEGVRLLHDSMKTYVEIYTARMQPCARCRGYDGGGPSAGA